MIFLPMVCVILMAVAESQKTDPRSLFTLLKPGETQIVRSTTKSPEDPTPPHTDVEILKNKMGRHLDTEYMAIDESTTTSHQPVISGRPKGRQRKLLKLLTSVHLGGGRKLMLKIDRKSRRKLTNYIWSFTACTVEYTWKNLGKRFFPQWIREGRCPKKSCSIPPGMACTPKDKKSLIILHWHCDFKNKLKCDWKFQEISVVTKCSCTC